MATPTGFNLTAIALILESLQYPENCRPEYLAQQQPQAAAQ